MQQGSSDATQLDPEWDSVLFNTGGCTFGGWFNAIPSNLQGQVDKDGNVFIAKFTVRQGFNVSGSFLGLKPIMQVEPSIQVGEPWRSDQEFDGQSAR